MYQFICIVFTATIAFFTTALAAEPLAPLLEQQRKCLSMHVVLNTFAGYITPTGKPAGFHLDFLTALAAESGLCIDIKLLPYARARRSIELGGHDGGILARTTNLDSDVVYLAKLITSKTVVVPRTGISLDNYQDLAKVTLGKVRGAELNDPLDNDPNISIVQLGNYRHGLRMLEIGRIDAIIGNELGLHTAARLEKLLNINWSGKLTLNQREVWLLLSKRSFHQDKAMQLRQAALTLIEQGVLDNILQKYFGMGWQLMR